MPLLQNETLLQFTERMSLVEKTSEVSFGPRHSCNSRAIFDFEGHHVHAETTGLIHFNDPLDRTSSSFSKAFRMAFSKPSFSWLLASYPIYGKQRAKTIAKRYNATLCEEPYPAENEKGKWWYLCCSDFLEVITIIYDLLSGEFVRQFGKESKPYFNLFMEQEQEHLEWLSKQKKLILTTH